jgi:predicted P-loop ATPase
MGYDPSTGRLVCSCELTGKKWDNCNVEKPGKHPWRGWKKSPMDTPEQSYSTFMEVFQQYPNGVNIGVRTGKVSGFWAVDLDVSSSKNGLIDIQEWAKKNNLTLDDLDSVTARTGGGGMHILFSYPPNVEKISTVAPHPDIGPAVDIKGDGGYILVEPSYHLKGRRYAWQINKTLSREMLKPAPERLIHIVETKKRGPGALEIAYTPSLEELKDFADELSRKHAQRSKQIGTNMLLALSGSAIMEDGGAHDAYRDIMYVVAKKWRGCEPKEVLAHFEDSIAARFEGKPDASTDIANLADSLYTALHKAREEAESWVGQVAINEAGNPVATDANILLYLENHPAWQGVFGYDLRRNAPIYLKPPPIKAKPKEFDITKDRTHISLWLQSKAKMVGKIGKDDLRSAILACAVARPVDRLQEYVMERRGTWDGVPRLETLLQRVAGTPDGEWVRTAFPLWMKSLVARILWPGCKVDTMLILEGFQGFKKSTFFRSLLPEPKFFSDSLTKVSHSTDTIRLIHSGPAIFELGELSGLRKQEVDEIKAFLSAQEDDLRPLYEDYRKTMRKCVFVGSTNQNEYLRDETGGRRFWPIVVTREIDIATVQAERDQLYAEAIARLEAGEIWWLPNGRATELAATEQEARYEEDFWHKAIKDWLADRATELPPAASATEQMRASMNSEKAGDVVTVLQVAICALKLEVKNAKNNEGSRIKKILRKLGWTPGREKVNGVRARVWHRPKPRAGHGHVGDTSRDM